MPIFARHLWRIPLEVLWSRVRTPEFSRNRYARVRCRILVRRLVQRLFTGHTGVIKFVMTLYVKQVNEGRLFLHEHPKDATSWKLKEVVAVKSLNGAMTVDADLYMFGLATPGRSKTQLVPAKKPATFMTNSWHLAEELCRRCDRSHVHQPLWQ